ncbi:MAG TPA: hypothetical protein VFU49_18565 [Ktedonobacteraceae bacterium]|nr:hypothetical protein [Ktedonobacteraceae bacterium]
MRRSQDSWRRAIPCGDAVHGVRFSAGWGRHECRRHRSSSPRRAFPASFIRLHHLVATEDEQPHGQKQQAGQNHLHPALIG